MNKSCELSCDEKVISILDDKARREYGDTLISFLKSNNLYKSSFASVTLSEGAEQLKERLGAFTGTYNGNGYEITGLTMTDPDAKIIGLFGVARDNAQIYNITLRDCDIMSAGRNAANISVGAIVAIAYGGHAYDNTVIMSP